tara:strand:+ start:436 stop:1083 length:648 start_codon:yes stop_codon:yes gene_type:complete
MGTITRSFANNITTSGVLLPASLTNASIANVTAYNASVATGGMVLISSATASASATIDFTLGDYKEYQFYYVNIHPASNSSEFQFQCSIDSGSTYGVTLTSTYFRSYHIETDAYTGFGYASTYDLAQSTAFQQLSRDTANASDSNTCGIMNLFNPSSTVYVKHFTASYMASDTDPGSENGHTAGYFNTTSALTNIRFKFDTGNVDDGTILMYGIV